MDDAWLPDNTNPFVISNHPGLVNQKVSSLLKMGVKEWDVEVIRDLFGVRDQNQIYGIPLSSNHDDDARFWCKERSGFYTVKSAYRLIQTLKGGWASNANSGFWRKLWNLKIPPKVKDFLCRACKGFLPTRVALALKGIPISVQCPTCNVMEESTMHCLVQCQFAKACGSVVGLDTHVGEGDDFPSWLEGMMLQFTSSRVAEVVMLLWAVWLARNKVVWHNTYPHVDEVVRDSRVTLDQWKDA